MNVHFGSQWFGRAVSCAAVVAFGLLAATGARAQVLEPTDQYLWLVPNAANTEQQGFIRLINHSSVGGGVVIWGIDAEGVRSPGTVSVVLSPQQALQVNSQDLESGNEGRGLQGALGSGTGDWTLVLRSDIDLEALAYIRTPSGFLTSMHDRVSGDGAQWWVPVFNPGNNPNQRSLLRVVNTEVDAVDLVITGIDDLGNPALGSAELSLSGLSSIELSALDLENGNPALGVSGGLGGGSGKWQLQVNASGRISVQSLLSDPNGNLTNLSSLPHPVQTAPGEHNIWLVPAAANAGQQGFIRLLNRSSSSGDVLLWGVDDAGQRSSGTITLTLAPDEARQLNSGDLEVGNPSKGVTGSLGSGTGNWRLRVMSDLDLVPMAFIRTPGGFLTSMHDIVAGDGLSVQLPIFNPGENSNQVSLLRLINDNTTVAQISISARDDNGVLAPGGVVTLTLAAGAATTLSAQDLENGNPGKGLSGALGNGNGKWVLTVNASVPLRLMSLLNDPQGFLTNLSLGTAAGSAALEPLPTAKVDPQFTVSGPSPFAAGCDGVPATGISYLNAEVEPHMAANPANLRNLVGAWQQDRWSDGGSHGIVTAASFDGGKTWTRRTMPFSRCGGGNAGNGGNFERASDPWVSFAPDGTAHLMALVFNADGSNAMLASRSLDGGLTWSAPIALITDGAAAFNDKNTLTADSTDSRFVYAVWDRLPASGGPAYFARSSNGGVSWEPAHSIYDPGANSQTIGNVIAVQPDGTLINLFTQIDALPGGAFNVILRVLRSLDKGITWSAPITVADLLAVGARDPDTGAPIRDGSILGQIAAGADGTLAVVWADARFGDNTHDDIALSVSQNGGLSWSLPLQVNTPTGTPAFTPSVQVQADGTIAVSYYDLRNNDASPASLPADYWLARSRSGASWSESHIAGPFDMTIAPNAGGFFLGDYQALVATGELLIPFYVTTTGAGIGNRTDVFAAPAAALLGSVAPLSAVTPALAAARAELRAPLSRIQAESLREQVRQNTERALQARLPYMQQADR